MFLIILTFSFHVVLLAIEIVLALLIPLLIYLGKQPQEYFKGLIAKRYMNYIAITYASQQVFLTASTVFTLSYYPDTLIYLGKALFYPLGFFILIYGFRLLLLSSYWYGWNRFPSSLHHFIGTLFAFTGLIILYLDSVILGFLGYPIGVEDGAYSFNQIVNFLNPLTLPLFLLFALFAVSVTFTILGFVHAKRIQRIQELEVGEEAILGRIYLKIASVVSMMILPVLLWYLISLHEFSYYKFSNMVGGLGFDAEGHNYSWLTIIFLISYVVYSITANRWNARMEELHSLEHTCEAHGKLLITQLISLLVSFLSIFLLNLLAQAPYFVASPELVKQVPFLDINQGINEKAASLDIYALTIFALIPLMLSFFVLLVFFFTGVIGDPEEDGNKYLAGMVHPKENASS